MILALALPLGANEHIASAPPGQVEVGAPSFVMFGRESLGLRSAPTDIRQLPDGRMVVAAQRELAIGDGVRWDLIRQAEGDEQYITQSIAINERGELFAGLNEGFGKLEFGPDGRWRFRLAEPLPGTGERRWPAFQIAEKVAGRWYWHSSSGAILRWDLEGAPQLIGSVDSIERVFALGDNLYVSNLSDGSLRRYDPAGLKVVIAAEATDLTRSITCSAPYGDGLILVGTNSTGLQLFDGQKMLPLVSKGVLSGGHRINDLCQATGQFYAAAVDTFGIVFFDRHGRIIQTLDRALDHRLSRVQRLIYTSNGELWALFSDGICRIQFPSRISFFEPLLNSGLSFVEPLRYEGRLWVLADGRAMRGEYDVDRRLVGFADDSPKRPFIFKLSSLGGSLLATSDDGIYQREAARWRRIVAGMANARILSRSVRPGWWMYIARNEVGQIRVAGAASEAERTPVPGLGDCYGAVIDPQGIIWLELGSGRVGRFDPGVSPFKPEVLDQSRGVPDSWASLYLLDGILRLNAANRVMRYDSEKRGFVDDTELLKRIPQLESSSGRPLRDSRGRIWVTGPNTVHVVSDRPDRTGGQDEEMPPELRPHNFVDDDAGVVWMYDKRRFVRYDPAMPMPEIRPVKAVIGRVELPGSGRRLISPAGMLPDLEYSDNSLAVYFAAPGSQAGRPVTFEFMLEGSGDKWVSTGIIGSTVFNRLKEGAYVLRVRPKEGETPGLETKLSFRILPPWYRTKAAYAAFATVFLLALASAILIPAALHTRQKKWLEKVVVERTKELNNANLLLARQVKETLEKASDLQASEERYRRLSSELEHRVEERTEELEARVKEVESLNLELLFSQKAADLAAACLQEANANLMVANQELESFSYSVSHDLRAPLRNIAGFIELLKRRLKAVDDKECNRFTDIIGAEATRMGALIDDLLAFSRIGRSEMKLRTLRIENLVEQVKLELSHDVGGRSIEWRVGVMPEVVGDETLLRQVIANLLANAVKFTRTREKTVIEVGAEPASNGGKMVTIFVRDNGVGFNPQYTDKLFQVFQRLHNSREFEGTGIGLANVKRIIARHGGQAWAVGRKDEGATFYFTLKRA